MENIKNIKKPNQIRALFALAKVSLLASLRNKTSLFFNFFFPFIFIAVFGLLGQGNGHYTVGVKQEAYKAGPLYEALKNVDILTLETTKTDEQLTEELNKGQIPVVINIQENQNVQKKTQTASTYDLKIEKSAADPTNAQATTQIIEGIVNQINYPPGKTQTNLINTSIETVAGRKYTEIDFILPGQLAFALLANAIFGISFTFVTMRKELIIKRIFATPTNRWAILGSEAVSRFVIAIMQAVLIIVVGRYLFNFTLANGLVTFGDMLILSIIGILVFLAFGLFVASIGRTEESISPIANLIMMPQLFLSGAFFSIDLFPKFLQPIAHILPMTFLNEAFRSVAFEGSTLTAVLPQIGGLIVWGIVMYLIDIKLFKWE